MTVVKMDADSTTLDISDISDALDLLESHEHVPEDRIKAYNCLSTKLKLGIHVDVISSEMLAANAQKLCESFVREITCKKLDPSNTTVLSVSLQTLGFSLRNSSFASHLNREVCQDLICGLCGIISSMVDKNVCKTALWCFSSWKNAPDDVLSETMDVILSALESAFSENAKNEHSLTVEYECIRFINWLVCDHQTSLGLKVIRCVPLIFDRLFHEAVKIRTLALSSLESSIPLISKYHDSVIPDFVNLTKTKMLKGIDFLMGKKCECFALDVWCIIVKILDKALHHGSSLINCLLEVVEKAFKSQTPDVRISAFHAWKELINNFSKDPDILSSPKRLRLLLEPLKINNARTDAVIRVKLKIWWHLLSLLGEQLSNCFELVAVSLITYCFGSLTNENETTKASSSNVIQSKATMSRTGDKVLLHMSGCKILALLLGEPLCNVDALPSRRTSPRKMPAQCEFDPLKCDALSTSSFFLKHRTFLYQACKHAHSILSQKWKINKDERILLMRIWSLLTSHIINLSESNDIAQTSIGEAIREFFKLIHEVMRLNDVPEVNLEILSEIVLNLPQKVLTSQAYYIGTTDLMHGTPSSFLVNVLFRTSIVSICDNGEHQIFSKFVNLYMKLLTYTLQSNPACTLSFGQSVIQLVCEAAPFISRIDSLSCLWFQLAEVILMQIDKSQEVNQGDSLMHDFTCMYLMLMFPAKYIFSKSVDPTSQRELHQLWTKLYKSFSCCASLVVSAETDIWCEELSSKLLSFVATSEHLLHETYFLAYMTKILSVILSCVNYANLVSNNNNVENNNNKTSRSRYGKSKSNKALKNLKSVVELLGCLLIGIMETFETLDPKSSKHKWLLTNNTTTSLEMADLLSNLFTYISNSDAIAELIKDLSRPVSLLINKQKEVNPKVINLWTTFVRAFEVHYCGPYDKQMLESMTPLLKVTLLHECAEIRKAARLMWIATFGQNSDIEYSSDLKSILAKTKPPLVLGLGSTSDDSEINLSSQISSESQDVVEVKVAPQIQFLQTKKMKPQSGSFLSKSPNLNQPKAKKSFLNSKKSLRVSKPELEEMNTQDFVPIKTPPRHKIVLTEHQKEVMKNRGFVPTMYNDLSQDASQLPGIFSSNTQDADDQNASSTSAVPAEAKKLGKDGMKTTKNDSRLVSFSQAVDDPSKNANSIESKSDDKVNDFNPGVSSESVVSNNEDKIDVNDEKSTKITNGSQPVVANDTNGIAKTEHSPSKDVGSNVAVMIYSVKNDRGKMSKEYVRVPFPCLADKKLKDKPYIPVSKSGISLDSTVSVPDQDPGSLIVSETPADQIDDLDEFIPSSQSSDNSVHAEKSTAPKSSIKKQTRLKMLPTSESSKGKLLVISRPSGETSSEMPKKPKKSRAKKINRSVESVISPLKTIIAHMATSHHSPVKVDVDHQKVGPSASKTSTPTTASTKKLSGSSKTIDVTDTKAKQNDVINLEQSVSENISSIPDEVRLRSDKHAVSQSTGLAKGSSADVPSEDLGFDHLLSELFKESRTEQRSTLEENEQKSRSSEVVRVPQQKNEAGSASRFPDKGSSCVATNHTDPIEQSLTESSKLLKEMNVISSSGESPSVTAATEPVVVTLSSGNTSLLDSSNESIAESEDVSQVPPDAQDFIQPFTESDDSSERSILTESQPGYGRSRRNIRKSLRLVAAEESEMYWKARSKFKSMKAVMESFFTTQDSPNKLSSPKCQTRESSDPDNPATSGEDEANNVDGDASKPSYLEMNEISSKRHQSPNKQSIVDESKQNADLSVQSQPSSRTSADDVVEQSGNDLMKEETEDDVKVASNMGKDEISVSASEDESDDGDEKLVLAMSKNKKQKERKVDGSNANNSERKVQDKQRKSDPRVLKSLRKKDIHRKGGSNIASPRAKRRCRTERAEDDQAAMDDTSDQDVIVMWQRKRKIQSKQSHECDEKNRDELGSNQAVVETESSDGSEMGSKSQTKRAARKLSFKKKVDVKEKSIGKAHANVFEALSGAKDPAKDVDEDGDLDSERDFEKHELSVDAEDVGEVKTRRLRKRNKDSRNAKNASKIGESSKKRKVTKSKDDSETIICDKHNDSDERAIKVQITSGERNEIAEENHRDREGRVSKEDGDLDVTQSQNTEAEEEAMEANGKGSDKLICEEKKGLSGEQDTASLNLVKVISNDHLSETDKLLIDADASGNTIVEERAKAERQETEVYGREVNRANDKNVEREENDKDLVKIDESGSVEEAINYVISESIDQLCRDAKDTTTDGQTTSMEESDSVKDENSGDVITIDDALPSSDTASSEKLDDGNIEEEAYEVVKKDDTAGGSNDSPKNSGSIKIDGVKTNKSNSEGIVADETRERALRTGESEPKEDDEAKVGSPKKQNASDENATQCRKFKDPIDDVWVSAAEQDNEAKKEESMEIGEDNAKHTGKNKNSPNKQSRKSPKKSEIEVDRRSIGDLTRSVDVLVGTGSDNGDGISSGNSQSIIDEIILKVAEGSIGRKGWRKNVTISRVNKLGMIQKKKHNVKNRLKIPKITRGRKCNVPRDAAVSSVNSILCLTEEIATKNNKPNSSKCPVRRKTEAEKLDSELRKDKLVPKNSMFVNNKVLRLRKLKKNSNEVKSSQVTSPTKLSKGSNVPKIDDPVVTDLEQTNSLIKGASPLSRAQQILNASLQNRKAIESPAKGSRNKGGQLTLIKVKSGTGSRKKFFPSPTASPSASILKKILHHEDKTKSPVSSKRRVSFADPPDQRDVETEEDSDIKESVKKTVYRCLDLVAMPKLTLSPDDGSYGSEQINSEEFSQACSQGAFFPKMLNCQHNVTNILHMLTSSMWINGLEQLLNSKNVRTVGEFCSLNEIDIKNLPIKSPKLQIARQCLGKYMKWMSGDKECSTVDNLKSDSVNGCASNDTETLPRLEDAMHVLENVADEDFNTSIEYVDNAGSSNDLNNSDSSDVSSNFNDTVVLSTKYLNENQPSESKKKSVNENYSYYLSRLDEVVSDEDLSKIDKSKLIAFETAMMAKFDKVRTEVRARLDCSYSS